MPLDPTRLREVELFAGLDDQELAGLAASAELRTAGAGEVLAREGASRYSFFAILEGTVDVERGGEILETLGPGDFFGEMAIVGDGRRNATVTASSRVELAVLFGTDFRTLEQEQPAAAAQIRQKVAERAERARR